MSLIVPWLLFPVVMGVLWLGVALLVEAASGVPLPEVLLLPVGAVLPLAVVAVADVVTVTVVLPFALLS